MRRKATQTNSGAAAPPTFRGSRAHLRLVGPPVDEQGHANIGRNAVKHAMAKASVKDKEAPFLWEHERAARWVLGHCALPLRIITLLQHHRGACTPRQGDRSVVELQIWDSGTCRLQHLRFSAVLATHRTSSLQYRAWSARKRLLDEHVAGEAVEAAGQDKRGERAPCRCCRRHPVRYTIEDWSGCLISLSCFIACSSLSK